MVSNEEIKRLLEERRTGIISKNEEIKSENYKICPNCKTRNPEKALFCVHCGNKLDKNSKNLCPNCGIENPVDSKFCVGCGKPFNQNSHSKTALNNEKKSVKELNIKTIPKSGIPSSVPEHRVINKTDSYKNCPSCKSKNLKDAKFCTVCGKKFDSTLLKTENPEDHGNISDKSDVPHIENDSKTSKNPDDIKIPKNTALPGSNDKKYVDETNNDKNTVNSSDDSKVIQEQNLGTKYVDPVEKIKKAKELLDIGAITNEEFENIKKKYLEQI